jgi:hypothetical protein
MMKKCTKCGLEKPLTEFHKRAASKDGLCSRCKECKRSDSNEYRQRNIDECRKRERDYANANKEKRAEKYREFAKNNPERIKAHKRKYAQKDSTKEKRREYARASSKEKRESDLVYRLKLVCRSRLHIALSGKGYRKKSRTFKTIGCSPEFLISHIESMFAEGMSWDNYGEWHIDHIMPLASAKNEDEVLSLSHYSNLQPMWASENLRKGANAEWERQK